MKTTIPHCNYCYLDIKNNLSGSVVSVRTDAEHVEEVDGAISKARSLGFKICLRGGLYGVTETTFMPSDVETFFRTFGDAFAWWAQWSQARGVELLGIGVELERLEEDGYSNYWRDVINKVRANFSGRVFYTTNWPSDLAMSSKKQAASWMNDLDLICISNYPNLMPGGSTGTPSVSELEPKYSAWGYYGINLVEQYRLIGAAHGHKVLFHMGLGSWQGAAVQPWASPSTGTVDLQVQANWLQAFFNVFGGLPWIEGWLGDGMWLTIPLAQKNPNNLEFSIQNKPATQVVEQAFESLSPEPTPRPLMPTALEAMFIGIGITLIGI